MNIVCLTGLLRIFVMVPKLSVTLSCDHGLSKFNYSPLGPVITGDLNTASNSKLWDIFWKGPKYHLSLKVKYDLICKGVLDCQTKWAKKKHVPPTVLDEWVSYVLSKVKNKVTKLSQGFSFPETQSIFCDKGLKNMHLKLA